MQDNATDVQEVQNVAQLQVRRPFELGTEGTRRFVRLEISTPMSLQKIRDLSGNFWPEGEVHIVNGMVLNISAGGVLTELDQMVHEGEIVTMNFTLQGTERLDHVLGLVKRVDGQEDCIIAGIEFLTMERLADYLGDAEIELLAEQNGDFNHAVREVLEKYVYETNEA